MGLSPKVGDAKGGPRVGTLRAFFRRLPWIGPVLEQDLFIHLVFKSKARIFPGRIPSRLLFPNIVAEAVFPARAQVLPGEESQADEDSNAFQHQKFFEVHPKIRLTQKSGCFQDASWAEKKTPRTPSFALLPSWHKRLLYGPCIGTPMESASPLVLALLYGKLDGLGEETVFLYARTGLIHLFSASGFHMGAALAISRLVGTELFRRLGTSRQRAWATFILSLALMTYFGSVTEWSSPMVRAFAFATLESLARALEIRAQRARLFLVSILVAACLGRGSWLSYLLSVVGMASIVFVNPRKWWCLLFAPWLATLPIVVWCFGLVSLSAPVWNLLAGSAVAFSVLPLSILGLLLEPIGGGTLFVTFASWIMERIHECILWGDALVPGALWVRREAWALTAVFLVLASLLRTRVRWAMATLAVFVPMVWPSVRLAALDVGQGDAIYLKLESGESLLVDTGPPGRKNRSAPVTWALERLGIGGVDHLLITHPDLDHRGGLLSLLARHRIRGALWLRRESLGEKGSEEILEAAERAGVPIRLLDVGGPPGLTCRWGKRRTRNDLSPLCVARLEGGKTLLLTGDMSAVQERRLLPLVPPVHYLKVAHHGSRSSSAPEFLAATRARVAIVSAGRKNRYGHPARETLYRLERARMEIRRTDQEGTLWLE